LRFLVWQPLFRAALPLAMLCQLGLAILMMATVPVYASQVLHGDAHSVGLMLSAFGIGSTVGMVLYGGLSARWPLRRGVTVLTFLLGMSLPLWLLPTVPRLAAALISLSLTGLFVGPLQVLVFTLLQTDTPPEMHGRVFSAFLSVCMAVTPAGLAIAGPILDRFGATPMVWGAALLISGTFLVAVSSRTIRQA
jgi:predicted MFS family arabinose efflux permease